jgi:predicted Zn-dependent protease
MLSNWGTGVLCWGLMSSVLVCAGAAQTPNTQAAGPCGRAPVASRDAQPNIFNDQQEGWLGEAEADFEEGMYAQVKDANQSVYVQGIVDRLAATLPPLGFKFKVMLVDSPEINAYSIAGGAHLRDAQAGSGDEE